MKVLVLGHKGMLGHMVIKYFIDKNINIHTISPRWPECKSEILNFKGDYIINCVGAIPQRTSDFEINWHLPIWLDLNAPCKVIHPGTDCEMDNDKYGVSKTISADYITTLGKQTKILKTSIIGPELKGDSSLLAWFLSQRGETYGYTNAIWNGNTTLEWSKQCLNLIKNWDIYKILTILEGESISKYNMLNTIKEIFNVNINIIPKELGKNKTLKGHIKTIKFSPQLIELKKYYYDNKY